MPRPPNRDNFSHVVGVVAPGGKLCHQVSYNHSESESVFLFRIAWCGRRPPIVGWKVAQDDSLENCDDCV